MATWRENLTHDSSLGRIADWPPVSLHHLTADRRSTYQRRYRAVALVLEGKTIEAAARLTRFSKGQVSKLMDRCLGTDSERLHPALSLGLVPDARLSEFRRNPQKPLKGGAGAFHAYLSKHPSIVEALDQMLLGDLKNRADAQRLTPKSFHKEFIELAKRVGTRADEYPFTTHLYGREASRQYFHRRRKELDPRPKRRHFRPDAHRPRITPNEIFNVVELDEHTIDAESAVRLDIDPQRVLKDLRVPRFMLALAVDTTSTAIVGVTFSFSKNPTEYALLRCLDSVENGSRVAVPGWLEPSSFPACLPQDDYQQIRALPGELRIDNALAHYSLHAHRIVCERWRSILNFGIPALPLARQIVEATFRKLEQEIHRLRSTSGTSVTDPNRESKSLRKRPPKVTLALLIAIVYQLVHTHNNKPIASFSNRTPTQYLLDSIQSGWLCRTLPPHVRGQPIWDKQKRCTVRNYGDPHSRINLLNVMYTGSCLTSIYKGQAVIAKYDVRDVRTVDVYTLKGAYIGRLHAPRRWLHHPHTEKERISIYRDHRRMVAQSRDPIGDLYRRHMEAGGKFALKALKMVDDSHSPGLNRIAYSSGIESTERNAKLKKKRRFTLEGS
jgi:putative transposase